MPPQQHYAAVHPPVRTDARAILANLKLALRGLQAIAGEGDANRDGALSYAELRDFVTARVTELTAGQQHPQLPFLDRFEPDALFARVPARPR